MWERKIARRRAPEHFVYALLIEDKMRLLMLSAYSLLMEVKK
jgi:hypothetical protein